MLYLRTKFHAVKPKVNTKFYVAGFLLYGLYKEAGTLRKVAYISNSYYYASFQDLY
jgi:hypothetical protein